MLNKFSEVISSKFFLKISAITIFSLSIFLRSIIDIGPDTAFYLDLGRKIFEGKKYYYDFFESNFPLSFYIYAAQYYLSLLSKISPIILSDVFINLMAIASIYWSAQILKRSTIYQNPAHYNLILISYLLGFFLRGQIIQLGEFGTKSSFLLICLYPYLSFSFERQLTFNNRELIQRGILMGLIPCFKPHYIIFIIFLETYQFLQKKFPEKFISRFSFFVTLDKLTMLLVGFGYLFLMIKFTPEFFEFIVPMWPKTYPAYDNLKVFSENAIHRFAEALIFCFIFLGFSQLKFSANDKVLAILFLAVSTLMIIENIGTIDQLGVFCALITICFLKFFYDLIMSQKFSFRDNKFIILVLVFWPLSDMEILPKAILGLSGFINVWWFIALVYPFLFCYKLKKQNSEKFAIFKAKNLTFTKIILSLLLYFLLLLLTLLALKYLGGWGFIAFNFLALFLVLFFFEKIYQNLEEKFSPFFVFTVMTSVSCLLYSYIAPLANLIPTKNYDTFPNKLSDKIAYYSAIYAPQKQQGFLVFSDLIVHQFPILNYLQKNNYYKHSVVNLIPQRGFLSASKAFSLNKDFDKIFTMSYLFEDLKTQLKNKNIKILFINIGNESLLAQDRCSIGFLEYYFLDQEFRKIFFENFRFENRILTSVEIKNPIRRILFVNQEKKDIFDQVKPATQNIRYNFEVYVRKNENL
ncbi:MAG: hypothetical protein SFV53_05960 [Rickettsiales bacterium]|nr:hypothetical protein [Rickettsiales bacterium]